MIFGINQHAGEFMEERKMVKMVKTWKRGRVELFDLSKDIGDTHNPAAEEPAKARELESLPGGLLKAAGAAAEGK